MFKHMDIIGYTLRNNHVLNRLDMLWFWLWILVCVYLYIYILGGNFL